MDMTTIGRRYVERWFWTLDELAEAAGAPIEQVQTLIAAGCAPGPIYVLGDDGWWSALGARSEPAPSGQAWYAPGAAWGLRRALLAVRAGVTPGEAAAANAARFAEDFVAAIGRIEGAERAFPDCFAGGLVDPEAAKTAAAEQWDAWLLGGYGVCLGVFTAETCIAKETLGLTMKRALAAGDGDAAMLLDQAEALAGLILPFAPWQRPVGTPGLTIDRLLAEQALGRERPYD